MLWDAARRERLGRSLLGVWGFQLLACFLLHALLVQALFPGLLDESGYAGPVLTLELLTEPLSLGVVLVGALGLVLARKHTTWRALDPTFATRAFVLAVTVVMTWAAATLDYNYYFEQSYFIDRLLLLICTALIFFHPGFVAPAVVLLVLLFGQINVPLPEGDWHWPDKRLPLDALILFAAFLPVMALTRAPLRVLVLAWLCLVAATYGSAALNKIRLGPEPWSWLFYDRISNVAAAAYQFEAGFLTRLDEAQAGAFVASLRPFDRVLAVLTLVIEGSAVLLVVVRRAALFVLPALIALHVGIAALTGVTFWKWGLFDAFLLAYLLFLNRKSAGDSFGLFPAPGSDAMSRGRKWIWSLGRLGFLAALIALFPVAFWGVAFAWWDTGFTNRFALTALGPNGERHRLDPRWFAPYDTIFVQSRFYYLTRRSPLTGTFGVAFDHRLERALAQARPDDIERVRARFATLRYYHPVLGGAFARFVTKVAIGRKARGGYLPHALAPPFHFQRLEPPGSYEPGMLLRAIEVAYEERFFDGTRFYPGHRAVLQTITVP